MPIKRDNEEFLGTNEAIAYLGISRDTFYRSIIGQLKSYRMGIARRRFFKRSDLDELKRMRPEDSNQ